MRNFIYKITVNCCYECPYFVEDPIMDDEYCFFEIKTSSNVVPEDCPCLTDRTLIRDN